jgi:type IV secretory pathway VirD2 relaxase
MHLAGQIAASRTSIKKQHQKIADLEDELELSRDFLSSRSDSIPADIIIGDLCHNRNVNPHGRRDSLETLS